MNKVALGLIKGALAGAVGVWVMDRITWYMYKHEDPLAYKEEKEAQIEGKYAAQVAASKLSSAFQLQLDERQEYIAGKSIHYLMGILPGAFYGAYRKKVKGPGALKGLLYGAGLFLLVDELVAPLLGLTSGPRAYPWQAHARGLAGHLALGATTDVSLKLMNKALPFSFSDN